MPDPNIYPPTWWPWVVGAIVVASWVLPVLGDLYLRLVAPRVDRMCVRFAASRARRRARRAPVPLPPEPQAWRSENLLTMAEWPFNESYEEVLAEIEAK